VTGRAVELGAVTGTVAGDAGVAHGAALLAFTNAVMADDDARLADARMRLRAVLTPPEFVDACAVIAAFNVVDRIADATGIPLDPMLVAASGDVRAALGLGRFASAANTPGAAAG